MPFIDPSDYGMPKLRRPLSQMPQYRGMTPPFLEEPPELEPPSVATAPPTLDTPPLQSPPQLGAPIPQWTSQDQANEMDRSSNEALEQYKAAAAKRPVLTRKKGFLGVLQGIGDAVVRQDVMHPEYTRQMQNYEQDLDAQGRVVKAAGAMADDARKRAQYESDLARNQKQEALYEEQKNTELAQQQKLNRRGYEAVGSHGYVDNSGVFHPAVKDEKDPTGANLLKQVTDRKVILEDKKKAGTLAPQEEVELRQVLEYLRKTEADIKRAASQTTLNLSGVTGRTAGGDLTLETLEDKRRAQKVRDNTDVVLAEAAKPKYASLTEDQLNANVMNPAFFDPTWTASDRAAIIAELATRKNKEKPTKGSYLMQLGKGSRGQAQPGSTATSSPAASASKASKYKVGDPVTLRDGRKVKITSINEAAGTFSYE